MDEMRAYLGFDSDNVRSFSASALVSVASSSVGRSVATVEMV
tara:strand:- start:14021 stop:14146 length:126 start_codon:yes stop_codon:yes gene_type:complete